MLKFTICIIIIKSCPQKKILRLGGKLMVEVSAEIQRVRDVLNDLVLRENISLTDKEVINLSLQLDELINLYLKLA